MQRLSDEDRERSEERARQEAMKSPEGRWRVKLQSQTEAQILDLVRITWRRSRWKIRPRDEPLPMQ